MSEGGGGPGIPKMGTAVVMLVLVSIALPTIVASLKQIVVPLGVLLILGIIVMALWKRIKHW